MNLRRLLDVSVGTGALDKLIAIGYVRRREDLSLSSSWPIYLASREARVEILPQYEAALAGLEDKELVWILWYPHEGGRRSLLERTLAGSTEILFRRCFSGRGVAEAEPDYAVPREGPLHGGESDKGSRPGCHRRHSRLGHQALGEGGTTTPMWFWLGRPKVHWTLGGG